MRITLRKPRSRKEDWIILKNGRKLDTETSRPKAMIAVKFYKNYFKRKRKQPFKVKVPLHLKKRKRR